MATAFLKKLDALSGTGIPEMWDFEERRGKTRRRAVARAHRGKKPHIGFLLQGLGAGGSERIVSLLCNHFAQEGWKVTLFAFEDATNKPYYPLARSVELVPLGLRPGKMHRLAGANIVFRRVRALRAALETARPDVLVSFLTRTNIYALLAARTLDCPVVISERNNPAAQRVGRVWKWLRRRTYPKAVGLVTMTRGAMEYFPESMRKRSWVIPNPVTVDCNMPRPLRNGRSLTAVGRLVPQKGFDLLIEAFARVAGDHPDWNLVIWGEGPEREALTRQIEALGLADRVSLPGVSEKPGEWIFGADVFVLSSRFEGWGLVLSEAMSAGLPVVAFDCQWGPAEMIEHEVNGLLVPDGDVAALAASLSRLLRDDARRLEFGDRGAESIQRFSPERITGLWEAVVGEALASAR